MNDSHKNLDGIPDANSVKASRSWLVWLASIVVLIIIWGISAAISDSRALPTPFAVLQSLITEAASGELFFHLFYFQLFDVATILAYTLAFVIIMLFVEFAILQRFERSATRWRNQDNS